MIADAGFCRLDRICEKNRVQFDTSKARQVERPEYALGVFFCNVLTVRPVDYFEAIP